MTDRDHIIIILVVACFAGTSFWPVVMGWVDVGTFAGWVELMESFGTCVLTMMVFSIGGIAGFFLLDCVSWCFRAVVTVAFDERTHLRRLTRGALRFLYVLLDGTWKFGWKLVCGFNRNSVGHKQPWCR